jgi:hypothetical protein
MSIFDMYETYCAKQPVIMEVIIPAQARLKTNN